MRTRLNLLSIVLHPAPHAPQPAPYYSLLKLFKYLLKMSSDIWILGARPLNIGQYNLRPVPLPLLALSVTLFLLESSTFINY